MSDYKGMLSPDNLRALADGVANQNAEAERVSRLYAASESLRDAAIFATGYLSMQAGSDPNALPYLARLRAALAKAEGRS